MSINSIRTKTSTLDIYIKLAQYPILADEIRVRMREELFRRGVISQHAFDEEVKAKAIESQRREGVFDPLVEEPALIWTQRKERIRAFQTDFYFGVNFPLTLFEDIVHDVVSNQPAPPDLAQELTFNPELAPWELLFRQGEIYESLPPKKRDQFSHHLEEIKVVLIKGMISDQLPYIGIAKRIFTIADLREIYRRRIGRGKIGGKAAGMLLAWRILQQKNPDWGPDLSDHVNIPDSYFIGTQVIYDFRPQNELDRFMNQKYRPIDEIRDEYPQVVEAYLQGAFPPNIVAALSEVLLQVGERPLIVRSSSLLEDNFGFSFAGKYESIFCPNQGTLEENLAALLDAIRRVYASTLNPDALLYRQKHGLVDYDERMAILLQCVEGERHEQYFYPALAGVAFSHNPFRWSPKIRREDGFLRLVWGLGTRAVDRVASDYPRLVALSHPQLRPETTARQVRQFSQHYVDVIDLLDNDMKTLPLKQVLRPDYPWIRLIASVDEGEYVQRILSTASVRSVDDLILTFEELTRDRKFIKLLRTTLRRLEEVYTMPVDVEFTVEIVPNYPFPDYRIRVLQCRPLSVRQEIEQVVLPENLLPEDILFTSNDIIPDGRVEGIRYIVFVDPEKYSQIAARHEKLEIGRAIGRLNKVLEGEQFILVGPGRWGSSNLDLGVKVTYADIYNTRVLVEVALSGKMGLPELSYGTHFFQDLVEAGIYPLPVTINDGDSDFQWSFFRETPNQLARLSAKDAELSDTLRVIDIAFTRPKHRVNILMDGLQDKAACFLVAGEWQDDDQQAQVANF